MVSVQGVFLSILPASDRERRLAYTVLAVSLAVFLAVVPFAGRLLVKIDAFIPAYESAVTINDLITAVLLLGQFSIIGRRGLLFLSCGYIFTGLMALCHMLSFPGLFAPGGLLTGGSQTTAWLYMFWHAGMPALVLAYALDDSDGGGAEAAALESAQDPVLRRRTMKAVAITLAVVAGIVLMTTVGHDLMPVLLASGQYSLVYNVVVAGDCLLAAAAIVALWRRQPQSVLDLWLMVVMCVWIFDIALSAMLNKQRFDTGFYFGRLYGLMAASFILLVLLLETRALFAGLARSLQKRADELAVAKDRLQQLNETLEQRVAERSRQLEAEMAGRARIEESMREAQKLEAVGQMAGGIAHDFNNLLTIMMGNAGFLESRLPEGPEKQSAATMIRAAERGARLVRQILAFSRRQSVAPEIVDLNRRSAELLDMLQRSTRGDIRIVAEIAADLWPVKCDVAELELALMNLCVNARDAMPKGGLVRLEARNLPAGFDTHPASNANVIGGLTPPADGTAVGDHVRISVVDTGTGIPPEVLKRVFEPFFTTKEVGKGTGLGLSQVYGFAQQAGGAAEISSAVGSGTTVSILLPRAEAETGMELERRAERAAPVGGGSVLLVDDDQDVAAAAATILAMIGYRAQHVANAGTALALLLGGQRFDLLLSDIVMPGGMNGIELAQRVRLHFPWLPVLLSTGFARPAAEVQQAGFELIAKPYNAASLLDAIIRARAATAAKSQNQSA